MSFIRRSGWRTALAVAALVIAVPGVATAQVAPSHVGHGTYGAHADFARFHGAGYQLHHGRNGEEDVNVCSTHVPAGTATCDARVVVKPAATAAATAAPVASNTSACSTTDVNAPSQVISGGNGGYDPCYLQSAYNAAAAAEGNGGKGQIVAIVDYSVDPNIAADLATYRAQFGLPACPTGTVSASNTGCVFQQVAQSGAPSSGTSGWDVETSLDVDTVSAICPNCQILLMEASSATTSALGSAVNTAVADGAIAVSNSYGSTESFSDPTNASSYYQHPGVAITVSSGDTAGEVQFPSSAPNVVAVGGTSLLQYGDQGTRSANATETVWDNTPSAGDGSGAGCSKYETAASWQSSFISAAGGSATCSKRVTADVSADADPETGVWIYDSYSAGGWAVDGGTSLASPLVAALYGLANNAKGSTSYPSQNLYANASSFYHVTSGSVGTCGNYLCNAADSINGYNGPTGIGTPGGAGALSAFAFNPAVAPAAPANLAATATASTATLTWTASTGAASYSVLDGTVSPPTTTVASGLTSTTYTVTGLSLSTTYYFEVTATNASGSATTTPVSVRTSAPSVPSAPTAASVAAINGGATLTWTAPSNNGGSALTGYTVYYSTTSGGELSGTATSATTSPLAISGLTAGTTYYFEVVANNAVGASAVSNEVSLTAEATPSAPTATSATYASSTITVSWTAPSNTGGGALTGYSVYYGTSSSAQATLLGTVSGTTLSTTLSSPTANSTYYFDVVATNAVASSVASNVVSVTTPVVAPPSAPTNITVQAFGSTVRIFWKAATGATSYTVEVSTSSTMSNPIVGAGITGTGATLWNASRTTTYYFEVIAVNVGSSTPSAIVSAKG
jgi:hypothetical protein